MTQKYFIVFLCFLTRVTSEDGCAATSGFQPWSQRLIPNINFEEKKGSLRAQRAVVELPFSLFQQNRAGSVIKSTVMFHEMDFFEEIIKPR